jgi:hypothetical protein
MDGTYVILRRRMNIMHTNDKRVWQKVMLLAKRRGGPGCPVSKKDLQRAYHTVRNIAIADTIIFKKLYITIEETNI